MKGPPRITIVGGGFSGASAAVQLVRHSAFALAVTIVEPRAEAGPGLAYASSDPDHRLNAPMANHSIDPLDALHFTRWCDANAVFERDAAALLPDGRAFVRRGDFGAYLAASVREHSARQQNGSTIEQVRGRALRADIDDAGGQHIVVRTEAGTAIESQMLIVATGNPLPRLPAALALPLHGESMLIADPLAPGRLRGIEPSARVLIVGSGLTALDAVSTLLRNGHRGPIVVVSRHGLRPRPHAGSGHPSEAIAESPLERILGPVPAHLPGADDVPTALGLTRSLRTRIAERVAQGHAWQAGFDELREVVWRVWPRLPTNEKRRFLQRLRPWYDVHRFRAPPQNDAMVRAAEAEGRVEFRKASVRAIATAIGGRALRVSLALRGGQATRAEAYDRVVNCTGFAAASSAANPFLASLLDDGRLTSDPTGLGFSVDGDCRAIDVQGHAQPRLRVIGPPTAGCFGDPLGVVFIAAQIHRMLPDALNSLDQNFSSKLRNSTSQLQAPLG